jgi:trimeric autotransporter adhesin
VYDPRNDISNYVNTTSDHGPVIARFELIADAPLAINQPKNENTYLIKAYPNPTKNTLNFLVRTDKKSTLTLYDLNGKAIGKTYEINGNKNSISFDVSQLQSGIYLYTLSQENKVIYSDKFIKQ